MTLLFVPTLLSAQAAPDSVELAIPHMGKLPQDTQMHGTAVVGQRLYIFGGETPGGWSNLVFSAEIGSNSACTGWRPETSLPVRIFYLSNSVEVVGNRIYLLGGSIAPEVNSRETATRRNQDVFWTEVAPDGTLKPWRKSPPFPGPHLGFLASCSTDRHLLVTGGGHKSVVASIYGADFAADGEPLNWRSIGELPSPLYQHGAAVLGGRLYVWGGLISRKNSSHVLTDPADVNARTWSAEIGANGTLGPWRDETPMPAPTFLAPASGFNDYLISIGGRYQDKTPTNSIWYARLDNGRIQDWKMVSTDLQARVFHSLGLDRTRGRIFITGGQIKTKAGVQDPNRISAVQAFQIPQPENLRLNTSQVASAASANSQISQGAGSGFTPLTVGLQQAAQSGKPVLAFFYSPQVPDCRRFWDNVIKTPSFQALGKEYVLSAVDISGSDTALGPRYGIYKVPALAVIRPDGTRLKSSIILSSMEDVSALIGSGGRSTAPGN